MKRPGIFSSEEAFSESCLTHYREEGWILVENLFDRELEVSLVNQEINHLIDLKLTQAGLPGISPTAGEIDHAGFMRLIAADRAKGGDIYRACRHLVALHQMSVSKETIRLAGALMQTQAVNYLPFTAVRIDVPNEDKYLFPWHQDYPYTQGSMDGVVLWIPMRDVPMGGGHLKIIPRSHRTGLRQVRVTDPTNSGKNGAKTIEISTEEDLETMPSLEIPARAGDALIFHTLLLHRSTKSTDVFPRWTAQLRYGNFSSQDAIDRGWPGGLIEGEGFPERHPEYVAK